MCDTNNQNEEPFELKPEKVYKELWKGREFELTHLWQRSLFLVTFMVAIATAYGTVLLKIAFPDSTDGDICINTSCLQHKIFIGLTCLGSMFSMLYTMMAKGSKYWYERYEAGIQYFTTGSYAKKMKSDDSEIPCHGNLPKLDKDKISDNPLSPLAGRYSVSKVNISIGIISLLIWGFLTMVHVTMFASKILGIAGDSSLYIGVAATCFFNIVLFFLLRLFCQSGDERDAK